MSREINQKEDMIEGDCSIVRLFDGSIAQLFDCFIAILLRYQKIASPPVPKTFGIAQGSPGEK